MSQVPARRRAAKTAEGRAPSAIDVSDLRALKPANASKGGAGVPGRVNGTGYGKAFKVALIRRLCLGDYLSDICSEPDMPAEKTVLEWLREDAELAALYEQGKPTRARGLLEAALSELCTITDRESAIIADKKASIRLRVAALLDPGKYSTSAHSALVHAGQQAGSVTVNINIAKDNKPTLPTIDVTPIESANTAQRRIAKRK